jgi:hypothetical protein
VQQAYNVQPDKGQKGLKQVIAGLLRIAFAQHVAIHLGIPSCPTLVLSDLFINFSLASFSALLAVSARLLAREQLLFALPLLVAGQLGGPVNADAAAPSTSAAAPISAFSCIPRVQELPAQTAPNAKTAQMRRANISVPSTAGVQKDAGLEWAQAPALVREFHIGACPHGRDLLPARCGRYPALQAMAPSVNIKSARFHYVGAAAANSSLLSLNATGALQPNIAPGLGTASA